jgi:hypothetical protein
MSETPVVFGPLAFARGAGGHARGVDRGAGELVEEGDVRGAGECTDLRECACARPSNCCCRERQALTPGGGAADRPGRARTGGAWTDRAPGAVIPGESPMSLSRTLTAAVLALTIAAAAVAQPAATYTSGGEFYLAYRAAFGKATKIDDLLPWMTKARNVQIAKAPADEKSMMFGMIKEMDDNTQVKVVKETPKGDGAELQVEAISRGTKSKTTATISLVKEGGAWKLDKESWKGGM